MLKPPHPLWNAYGNLPAVEDVALSPSGENLAVIGTIDSNRVIMFLNRDMELMHINQIGDIKSRALTWIGEEAVLMTFSETVELGSSFAAGQQEITNAMVVPARSGREGYIVFGDQNNIANGIFGMHGIREIDGEWFGFFGGIELEFRGGATIGRFIDNTRPALFAVNFSTGAAERRERPPSETNFRDWLVDETGQVPVQMDLRIRNGVWQIENAANQTLVEGRNNDGNISLIALAPDGDSFIFGAEDPQSGLETWYLAPFDGSREPQEFLSEEGVENILVDPDSGRMLGYIRPTISAVPTMFDEQTNDLMQGVQDAFPGRRMELASWSRGFTTLVVRTAGNGDSGSWYLIDTEAGEAVGIAKERITISASQVGQVSSFSYNAADGLLIDGVLTLPPGRAAENLPAIILPHGGPAAHDVVTFNWFAQAFASQGYAVLQPNFRGSTNRTQQFQMAGHGEWGRAMQSDLSDGLTALADEGIVDPGRACIVGMSYGGYAALAGVTLQQGLYRCAVAVAPVSDLELHYNRERRETGGNNLMQRSLLETLGPSSRFDELSPRRFASRADAPILLIHGRDDTVVHFEQSSGMADALDDNDMPYRMVELEGEDHWLSLAETRRQMLREAMAFVQKHNPPD